NVGSVPHTFTLFNNKLFFIVEDNQGEVEWYVTEGTESTTRQVNSYIPGYIYDGNSVSYVLVHNNLLYFSADLSTVGQELFKIDPTYVSIEEPLTATNAGISLYPNPASQFI